MASVTQCDTCKNVCKNEEAKFITINRCDTNGTSVCRMHEIDLCPTCYEKLCKLLKVEETK